MIDERGVGIRIERFPRKFPFYDPQRIEIETRSISTREECIQAVAPGDLLAIGATGLGVPDHPVRTLVGGPLPGVEPTSGTGSENGKGGDQQRDTSGS